MRRLTSLALCLLIACSSGCAVLDAGKDITKQTAKTLSPRHRDYGDNNDESYIDEWAEYSTDARGDTPRSHESDGLTKYVQSPKAQAIERSLGYD